MQHNNNIIINEVHIPTNLSNAKSGTISLKKRDFWSKSGTFSRNSRKSLKLSTYVMRQYCTKMHSKKWDKVKKKQDGRKFWSKHWDCPAKNGTVPLKTGQLESMYHVLSRGISKRVHNPVVGCGFWCPLGDIIYITFTALLAECCNMDQSSVTDVVCEIPERHKKRS